MAKGIESCVYKAILMCQVIIHQVTTATNPTIDYLLAVDLKVYPIGNRKSVKLFQNRGDVVIFDHIECVMIIQVAVSCIN